MALKPEETMDNGADSSATDTEPKTSLEAVTAALETQADDEAEPSAAAPATEDGEQEAEQAAPGGDAEAAAAKGADQPAAPAKDEDLHRMPEGLGEKAQERFQRLVEANKDATTKVQTLEHEVQEMREAHNWLRENVLTDEGAADDLVSFAEYRKAMAAGDMEAVEKVLLEQIKNFTLMTGRSLAVDALADFPDLREKVANLEIDEPAAIELARYRQQQRIAQQGQTQQQEVQRQHQAFENAKNQAVQQIATLDQQWMASDPDYPAKQQIINDRLPGLMQEVAAGNLPVHLVPQQIRLLYESLSGVTQKASNVSPLRPSGGVSGKAQPQSSLEAVGQALGYN